MQLVALVHVDLNAIVQHLDSVALQESYRSWKIHK